MVGRGGIIDITGRKVRLKVRSQNYQSDCDAQCDTGDEDGCFVEMLCVVHWRLVQIGFISLVTREVNSVRRLLKGVRRPV